MNNQRQNLNRNLRYKLTYKMIDGAISDEEYKVLMNLLSEDKTTTRVDQTPPKPYNAVIEPGGDGK